ncbi:alpha/beta fold hydrolase [uncultured Clostridium sp.]|uniref:alpha/beta fold hydrolase n=1 Tax=uncultured Clostridium sp. TaxID=59620 RepID=UPI0028EAF9FB|nr:alpha/beta fold hydrolase [uncultured Clostridium sp.]
MFKIKRKFFVFGAILTLFFIGYVWQDTMQKIEIERYRSVGTFVNVNSHNIHTYVQGDGTTCFVFMAGSGTPCAYSDFYNLQNEFSQYSKTITYDHAGFGWSEKTSSSRVVDTLADELNSILNEVDAGNECILICHSLASLEAIRFAQLYSNRVKGIVFLDSGSPEFYSTNSELQSYILNRVCSALRVTGINRLLGNFGVYLPIVGENDRISMLPDEIKHIDKVMYYRYLGNKANVANINLINENAQTVLNGNTLVDIPILVLSSDSGEKWGSVQNQLSKWSENNHQVTIENSGHYIHWTNQHKVIEKIHSFVEDINK